MVERILMCGNEALAEAAILAGCDAYFGYPITPQNEISAYMARRMAEEGRVFIQSESELAAINMVFGAAATGKRAMTSSSSPGISLMQEGISYLAGAELPAVIVNVMRGGPGLGNIAPSQGDYFQATRGGGHGDYKTIVLGPSSVQELADCMSLAFDLADQYRTPVLVLADGILGQMMEPVALKPPPRRELPPKDWALTGMRGRKQNIVRSLWLGEGVLEKLNEKLQARYRQVEEREVLCEEYLQEDDEIIVVAYGIAARIARAAVDRAREKGFPIGLLRPITLWPFPAEQIRRAAERARVFLTIEMSAGQMLQDVQLAVAGRVPVLFYGRMGGGVPTVDEVLDKIKQAAVSKGAEPLSPRESRTQGRRQRDKV
jgi:2-oxoglutarate ferredoxin oxidoreductase subunit alpha